MGNPLNIVVDNIQFKNIPIQSELMDLFSKKNPKKAFGENRLDGTLFKRFADLLSTIYYPIVLECMRGCNPPCNGRVACW